MPSDHPACLGLDWSRRDLGRAITSAAALGWLGRRDWVAAGEIVGAGSLLGQFVRSLTPEQRRAIVFPFDDPRRTMVANHWAIVPDPILALTLDQQDLAFGLIRQVCTPDGFTRLARARADDSGGWKHDHIAVFGDPADPRRSEWVLTGRHLTLRGSATGQINGGPLFFGHSASLETSIWRGPAEQAARLNRSLTSDQRSQARAEGGLNLGTISPIQQTAARQLLASVATPFRAFNAPALAVLLEPEGDWRRVCWQAFGSVSDGCKPDADPLIWRFRAPGLTWSFHAEPHVHSWLDLT